MAGRNGSGVFTVTNPDFVSGTTISSSEVDANNADIATGITQSIAVDGQTTITGDIPFASNKITGLAVGTALTDALTLGQAQNEGYIWCGTMTGTADAGVLTPSPAITAYAAGQRFAWKASANANTGAMTIAISGLSAIAAQNDRAALAAGIHAASDIYMGVLDTTSTIQIMKFSNTAAAAGALAALDTVSATEIDSDAVTTAKILDANVTTGKVADNAITLAKMAGGTDGNLITYDASGDPAYVVTGTAGQVLTSNGAGAAPTMQTLSNALTFGTRTATTSGTAFTFGSLPAGITELLVFLDVCSLSGTDSFLVTLGDSGGLETSGYVGKSAVAGAASVDSTSGMPIYAASAAGTITCTMSMHLVESSSNTWQSTHNGNRDETSSTINGSATKSLSGELTQVSITRTGTDTFDAGNVTIAYR